MSFPKFIIETDDLQGDCLIIGKVQYHKNLAVNFSKVKGGGWWTMNEEKTILTFWGNSQDFGRATIEDINACIQRKKVFSNPALDGDITDRFDYKYKKENGVIIDL